MEQVAVNEHIEMDSAALPGSVTELEAPSLSVDANPVAMFYQSPLWGRRLFLDLYPGGLLTLKKSRDSGKQRLLRTGILNVDPGVRIHGSLFCLGFSALVFGVLSLAWHFGFLSLLAYALSGLMLTGAVLMSISYRMEIRSACGGIKLLELRVPFYQRSRLRAFGDKLDVERHQCMLAVGDIPRLVQEHRRLQKEGVISLKDYELAKRSIFSGGSSGLLAANP